MIMIKGNQNMANKLDILLKLFGKIQQKLDALLLQEFGIIFYQAIIFAVTISLLVIFQANIQKIFQDQLAK